MEDRHYALPMTFDEYQAATDETVVYARPDTNFMYPALKLAGEAGEVAEEAGKIARPQDDYNSLSWTPEDRMRMAKELGDVLWYVARVAKAFKLSMNDVATMNLDKLRDRKARGVIDGRGSDR